jgi:SAM-dependent methyltransferase
MTTHRHSHDHGHSHTHDDPAAAEAEFAAMFELDWWQERYGDVEPAWSGQPNLRLVEQVGDLTPGTALEVGCGEGADAIWLAERGWTVSAVDFSQAGLDRARAHAESVGADVAARITWLRQDLRSWTPPTATFDLVTAHYMHQPSPLRRVLFAALADAVRPGGNLLIVGHHPRDLATALRTPAPPELMQDAMFTAEQVASEMDPHAWRLDVVETAARTVTSPDGEQVTVHDAVLRAHRLAS